MNREQKKKQSDIENSIIISNTTNTYTRSAAAHLTKKLYVKDNWNNVFHVVLHTAKIRSGMYCMCSGSTWSCIARALAALDSKVRYKMKKITTTRAKQNKTNNNNNNKWKALYTCIYIEIATKAVQLNISSK